MTKIKSAQDFQEPVLTALESHFSLVINDWLEEHHQNLLDFSAAVKELEKSRNKKTSDEYPLLAVWGSLVKLDKWLGIWLKSTRYVADEPKLEDLLLQWDETRSGYLEKLPSRIVIPLDETFWKSKNDEGFRISWWRRYNRWNNHIAPARNSLINVFRKIRGADPVAVPPLRRQFGSSAYVYHIFENSYQQFLMGQRDQFLHLAAQHLHFMHEMFSDILNRLLFIEEEEQAWLSLSEDRIWSELDSAIGRLPEMANCDDQMEVFRQNARQAFADWREKTSASNAVAWEHAGTWALPRSAFSKAVITSREEKLQKSFLSRQKRWSEHFTGEREDWQHDIDLNNIQLHVGIGCFATVKSIRQRIDDQVKPALSNALEPVLKSLKAFQATDNDGKTAVRKMIVSENRTLLKTFRKEILPQLTDILVRAQFHQLIRQFDHQAQQVVEALPEKQLIFAKKDLEGIPPRSEVDDIPFKAIFDAHIYNQLSSELGEYYKEVRDQTESTLRDISELDQIIEFNLEAALNALKQDKAETARQTAMEGLERAQNRVESFVNDCDLIPQEVQKRLMSLTYRFVVAVQDLLDSEKLIELKIQLARARVQEQYRTYRRKAWKALRYAIPLMWSYVLQGFNKSKEIYDKIGRWTGLTPAEPVAPGELTQFLLEAQQSISQLPYVYQRLFKLEPLKDERFFAGHDEHLAELEKDFTNWKNGQFMATVIVGERGSGKTTLLNFCEERILKDIEVVKIDIQGKISSEKLLANKIAKAFSLESGQTFSEIGDALNSVEEPMVCIVENTHHLFSKTTDGFELMEEFLFLTTHTSQQVFWIMTSTLYSWEYLDKVISIGRFVPHVLRLEGLTGEEIESIILKRHRVTGYDLRFEAGEAISETRKFRKLKNDEEQQAYLHDLFFQRLQQLAQGNITVTILYWLKSIISIDKNQLLLTSNLAIDYSFVDQLPGDEVFTLGAIVQHESLTAEDLSRIFYQEIKRSQVLLRALCNKGILVEDSGVFNVHPLLYRAVIQSLKRKYILH